MCHPGLPPLPPGCAVARRRARPTGVVAPTPVLQRQVHTHHYCVCSPTAHRGSFRCRWHRGSYQWGSRLGRAAALGAVPAVADAAGDACEDGVRLRGHSHAAGHVPRFQNVYVFWAHGAFLSTVLVSSV